VIDKVLAIETSCDDTSVALVDRQGRVHGMISQSQDAFHEPFGGIVPEIACRNHSLVLLGLVDQLLRTTGYSFKDIDGFAVTNRPGLVGSLIVGIVTAKTLAQAHAKPLIGVNHLEGHILAPFLQDDQYSSGENFGARPFVCLAVSGGHTSLYHVQNLGTYKVLGATLDDAAGEAFDKFGKMLGLGWPGGSRIDLLSKTGNKKAFDLPRSMIKEDHFLFSFSGLKSSAQRLIESLPVAEVPPRLADLSASFQEAVVDVLISKLQKAIEAHKVELVAVTGGVSANSRLRERAQELAVRKGVKLIIPPMKYCTDNAAMIGLAGVLRLQRGERHELNLGPSPSSWVDDFQGTP
jgi:N6-L-threonylcarbamoyladenine synthase